jgi:glucokinase
MVLVFNVGGTKTKIGISRDGENLAETWYFETPKDFDKWLTRFSDETIDKVGKTTIDKICGGIAGVWDLKKTKLFKSPNLPDWESEAIRKHIEAKFDAKVTLDNDVVMEGLGEARLGAGRRKQIVAFLGIGTGIGGVKLVEGRVSPVMYGSEPGHMIIEADGEVGYWENFASGAAMERMYGKKPDDIDDAKIWDEELKLLAIGIHNVVMMWSPEMVILGGGLANKIDIKKLTALVRQQMIMFPKLPEIAMSELGDKAGLYGALEYLRL